MLGQLGIFGLLATISSIRATYNGPFILWGRDELSNANKSPLNAFNEKTLHDIYSDSSAIIIFVRNATSPLREENFPIFKDLLAKNSHVYLTQQHLSLDPMEFNLNAEVINLVGPTSQQDVELSALYRDAVLTYGDGKVLGILATKTNDHEIRKRDVAAEAAPQQTPSTPATPTTEPDQGNQSSFVYYPGDNSAYKILLYTELAPRLFIDKNQIDLTDSKTTITTDRRSQTGSSEQRTLKVRYNTKDKLTIEYLFNITGGYWTLIAADIDWPKSSISGGNSTLYLLDDRPAAPLEFSYKCSRPLVFQNGSVRLELANIQVQLDVAGRRFNDSYDCIGFTSAPIWSGVFVTFIICLSAAIALGCIMDIKPPNRFENSRGKQLTFTIQE